MHNWNGTGLNKTGLSVKVVFYRASSTTKRRNLSIGITWRNFKMILITRITNDPEKFKPVDTPASGAIADSSPVEGIPASEFPGLFGHRLALPDSTLESSGVSLSPLFINSTRSYSDE
jgi:hypothetical protein